MDRTYYMLVNGTWFIISETNHTFTGTAEEIYKKQTSSTDVVTAEY